MGGSFPSLFERVDFATSCRMICGWRGIIESMDPGTSCRMLMRVRWDFGRKIQFILPKERNINLSLSQCLLQFWTGSTCRMTSRAGDRMEDETSSIEVSAKNDVKWHDWNSDVCMIFIEQFKAYLLLSFTTHFSQKPIYFIRNSWSMLMILSKAFWIPHDFHTLLDL